MNLQSVEQEAEHKPLMQQRSGDSGEDRLVTPAEFAEALARYEARQDADTARHRDRVLVREALEHIGSDAPPETIAQEVDAIRAAREREQARIQTRRQSRRIIASILSVIVLGFALTMCFLLIAARRQLRAALRRPTDLQVRLLSGIPVGVPVHIDSDSLLALASNDKSADNTQIDARTIPVSASSARLMFQNEWTIVRQRDGSITVRAVARADQALAAANGAAAAVYSEGPAWIPAANMVPVDLPLFQFYHASQVDDAVYGVTAAGVATNGGDSVLQTTTLSPQDSAAAALVSHKLNNDTDVLANAYSRDYYRYDLDASAHDGVIHITGSVASVRCVRAATTHAEEIVREMHLPYRIVNELKVGPDL